MRPGGYKSHTGHDESCVWRSPRVIGVLHGPTTAGYARVAIFTTES